MATQIPPQIGEETKVTVDLKTIGMIVGFTITLATMWFTLQADIALAMEKPEPPIDRVEYDLNNYEHSRRRRRNKRNTGEGRTTSL